MMHVMWRFADHLNLIYGTHALNEHFRIYTHFSLIANHAICVKMIANSKSCP